MSEAERHAKTLDYHGLNESAALLRKQDVALKLALAVLIRASESGYSIECEEAITAIQEARNHG